MKNNKNHINYIINLYVSNKLQLNNILYFIHKQMDTNDFYILHDKFIHHINHVLRHGRFTRK